MLVHVTGEQRAGNFHGYTLNLAIQRANVASIFGKPERSIFKFFSSFLLFYASFLNLEYFYFNLNVTGIMFCCKREIN